MAAVDVSAALQDVVDQALPVALIGAAVLLVYVSFSAFKWLKSALGFGNSSSHAGYMPDAIDEFDYQGDQSGQYVDQDGYVRVNSSLSEEYVPGSGFIWTDQDGYVRYVPGSNSSSDR